LRDTEAAQAFGKMLFERLLERDAESLEIIGPET
jgi:hypothetical protein